MRLSLAYEMQRPMVDDHAVIEETLEQCVLADEMGFDTIWFVEHWNQIDADTLVDRGVLVAGDPESCLRSIAIHEEAGVDELQFLLATESVPHERAMSSIAMFGKHVIPELRRKAAG